MINDKNNFINSENDSFGDLFSHQSSQSQALDFESIEESLSDAI